MDTKQMLLLIFVIGISVVFIVQMFAVGSLGQRSSSKSGDTDSQIYPVRLTADSKLTSYGSYLSVQGSYDELNDILMGDNKTASLISSMIDISDEDANKTLVYLSDSLYTKQVSDILSDYGYKMHTDVNIQLPDNITLEGKAIDLNGNSIKLKAPPVYDIGSTVKVSLSGYVQYNKLIYITPDSISVNPVTKDAVVTMTIKNINKIEFAKEDKDIESLEKDLDEIIDPAKYSLELSNNTVALEFNVTANDTDVLDDAVDYLGNYLNETELNNTKSYVRLYSGPAVSQGVYDPITFNYPLPGLRHIGDEIDMNVTLSLDWGNIVDIKMVRMVE